MKKSILLILLMSFVGSASFAQLSIDRNDFGDVDTSVVQILEENPAWDQSILAKGTGLTWDFTKYTGQGLDTVDFRRVNSHPEGSRFPIADLVLQNRQFDLFVKLNTDSVYTVGVSTTASKIGIPNNNSNVAINFDQPQKRLDFPITMGQTYTSVAFGDTIVDPADFGYPQADSARIELTLTTYSEAEAEGTIKLFSGTHNVLKVKTLEVSEYDVYLYITLPPPLGGSWQTTPTIEEVDSAETYSFYAKNKDYAIAEAAVDPSVGNELEYVQYQLGNSFIAQKSVTDESCIYSCDGKITFTPLGGSGNYSYNWHGSVTPVTSTTNEATQLCEGMYYVTITDQSTMATYEDSAWIEGADSLSIALVTNNDEVLGQDGELEVSASGGTGNFIYEWSNNTNTARIQGLEGGDYTVTITDGNGCKKSATYTVNSMVNVEELGNSSINIYPNPASNFIKIEGFQKSVDFRLVSVIGKVVLDGSLKESNSSIDVSGVDKGLYLLEITSRNSSITKRVYIED